VPRACFRLSKRRRRGSWRGPWRLRRRLSAFHSYDVYE
jgi:hypothetical protein